MGKITTNNEIRIDEIDLEISKLQEEKRVLLEIEKDVCPECGSYESDWDGTKEDELGCRHEYHDNEENQQYLNHYKCTCGEEWSDQWNATCNDKCPECNSEIEPHESEEL